MALHDVVLVCPYCDKRNDALSNADDHDNLPKPGDMAICFTCRKPWLFDDNLQPRKPAPEEEQELAADARYQQFLRMKMEGRTPRSWK